MKSKIKMGSFNWLFSLLLLLSLIPKGWAQNKRIELNGDTKEWLTLPFADPVLSGDAKRHRKFTINPILQDASEVAVNDTIHLDLFPDKAYETLVLKVYESATGTTMIRSKILNTDFGYCFISTHDGKSELMIEIPDHDEYYVSKYSPETGRGYLLEIDPSNRDINVECGASHFEGDQRKGDQSHEYSFQASENEPIEQDEIGLMIVYTPAATQWAAANETSINHTISKAIDKSQLVLDNSQVFTTINLVHAVEVSYTETNDIYQDLVNLSYTGDGYMDEVHTLRDQYGADLVMLLEVTNDGGGIAWILPSSYGHAPSGFSVVRIQQASGTNTPIHEMGHNFGCHHHKDQNVQPGPGLFTYSSGWRWTGVDNKYYSSVMTYSNGKYFEDGITHKEIPYFSNPNINYQQVPTGDAIYADNARTILETKSLLASYRSYISASANPSNGGTVSGQGWYTQKLFASVTAEPAEGYSFTNWTEDGVIVSFEPTYQFVVEGDRNLVANFTNNEVFTISATPAPINAGSVTGQGSYYNGQTATLTASVNPDAPWFEFSSWTEGFLEVSNEPTYIFEVTKNRNLTANFTWKYNTISVSSSPANGGTVSGGGSFRYGQTARLQATPSLGYGFVNWTENGIEVTKNTSYVFTVTEDRSLTANFVFQSFVWDGEAGDRQWSTAENWEPDAVPTSNDHVLIPSTGMNPIIAFDEVTKTGIEAECKNLVIEAGASLLVQSGASLMIHGSASIDPNGNFTMERRITDNLHGLSMVASPVTGQKIDELDLDYVYSYTNDGTIGGTPDGYSANIYSSANAMGSEKGAAQGYFAGSSNPQKVLSFQGIPNTGEITYQFSDQTEGSFELVGNPYTAPLSYELFIADNDNIGGTLYIWNDADANDGSQRGGDYNYINASGMAYNGTPDKAVPENYTAIPSVQAFWVELGPGATLDNSLDFSVAQLSNNGNSNNDDYFFRSTKNIIKSIKLSFEGEGFYNELIVVQSDEATTGPDRLFDAKKLNSDYAISFYSITEEVKYAIQGVPKNLESVTLGFDASIPGHYQLSVISMDDEDALFIVRDKLANVDYQLHKNLTIPIAIEAPVKNDTRFELLLDLDHVLFEDSEGMVTIKVYGTSDNLVIEYPSNGKERVIIYSLEGQVLYTDEISFHENQARISPSVLRENQVYILQIGNKFTKFIPLK